MESWEELKEKLNLPDDLREMNKEQFLEVAKWLIKNSDIKLPDSQLLLVIRKMKGMNRETFAKILGISPEVLRHVEAGRKKVVISSSIKRLIREIATIEKEMVSRWLDFHNRQFFQKGIDEVLLKEVKSRLSALKLPNDWREMNFRQFLGLFKLLKERTNNFTKIRPEIIMADSRIIQVFRIILGLSQNVLTSLPIFLRV
ncbi:MAG: helix-turn-helix transcriptional regulator [Candidatus Aenigmarchaeota archaeon]|nr:helix-turn-helix transcriptional regulator [Candidatus Aenigmarchaeota archaeon]